MEQPMLLLPIALAKHWRENSRWQAFAYQLEFRKEGAMMEGGAREGGNGKMWQRTDFDESTNDYFVFRQMDFLIIIKFDNYSNNLITVELAYHIQE